jgi:outer membrane murein-binding lipoprotein Lpp
MAVYEGARQRSTLFPRRRLEAPLLSPQAPVLQRRRSRVAIRANKRPRSIGMIIGAIVVAFLLSFFSLVQTVRISASGYDVAQLNDQYVQLENQRQQIISDIDRLGRESAMRRQAISDGLSQLPAPVILPAR